MFVTKEQLVERVFVCVCACVVVAVAIVLVCNDIKKDSMHGVSTRKQKGRPLLCVHHGEAKREEIGANTLIKSTNGENESNHIRTVAERQNLKEILNK